MKALLLFFVEISAPISNKSSIKLMCISSYNNCSIDKSMPGPFGVDILSIIRHRAAVERLGCTFEWLLVSKVLWYQTEAELRWLGARTIVKSCSGSLEPSCISSPSLNSETFHPSPSLTLIPPGNHHDLVWLIVLRSLLEVSSPWMSGQELWNYCPDFETCSLNVIFKYAEIKCTADKSSRTFQIKCIMIAYLSCGILSAFGISQSIKQYRMVYWMQSNTEIQHPISACCTHDQYAATIHKPRNWLAAVWIDCSTPTLIFVSWNRSLHASSV